jgi:flavin reductase (DIM6/NTAB) family NADH-FMN oxidoreductase RutF
MQASRTTPFGEVNPTTLKAVMGRFATGMTIVAAIEDGQPVGSPVRASSLSLSLDRATADLDLPSKSSTS